MTKFLDGSELVGYIKERQAKQVRALRQAAKIAPKLVILMSLKASKVITTYVSLKKQYGEDILVDVSIEALSEDHMAERILQYNHDQTVHGIIVQLPLDDKARTDETVSLIAPEKDVDGLGSGALFDSATAMAINWLVAGYGIDLRQKTIAIVGNGRLVGAPLATMWQASGYNLVVLDRSSASIKETLRASNVIVTATGVPGLINSPMVGIGAIVIDAGTASEDGMIVGDVDESVRERDDITITPKKGGVGPLTVAALFDNVITSARRQAEENQKATR